MMQDQNLQFSNSSASKFSKLVSSRVHSSLRKEGISLDGGYKIMIKSILVLSIYFVPYLWILFADNPGPYSLIAAAILMGVGLAGIGFSIMHDANHGSYSKWPIVNKVMGLSLNMLGGNRNTWRVQHNYLHHTYTNIHGIDEDIQPVSILRFSPNEPLKPIHRYQPLYAPFLYGLMSLVWVFQKDFGDAFKFRGQKMLGRFGTNVTKELCVIVASRVLYFGYMIAAPIFLTNIKWWVVLLGFFIIHFVGGVIMSTVFQLAHVTETRKYPVSENNTIDSDWSVHQLETTQNFAKSNKLLSWYVGGLNFQIEHHLFPHISHIHYPMIAPLVEAAAQECGLEYRSSPSFTSAIIEHFKWLSYLGRQSGSAILLSENFAGSKSS